MATSREIVYKTLEMASPERAPRNLWALPWASNTYPEMIEKLNKDFPTDISTAWGFYKEMPKTVGEQFEPGLYIDEWGCRFTNIQRGIVGEIKEPIIAEDDFDWADTSRIHFPRELLTVDTDMVNRQCRETELFMLSWGLPRPFEQLQFIRKTEELFLDLAEPTPGFLKFVAKMHEYYCELCEIWAKTDVDALQLMDDWGSQTALLINPKTWVEIFKPMYKDYCDIAKRHGKRVFMHSDGHILAIYPHLVEIGVDALNSQIFCMGLSELEKYRGKITFWGEIDRQHILPYASKQEVANAVCEVKERLWQNGGCVAQCEFGMGSMPENVYTVFETWDKITKK